MLDFAKFQNFLPNSKSAGNKFLQKIQRYLTELNLYYNKTFNTLINNKVNIQKSSLDKWVLIKNEVLDLEPGIQYLHWIDEASNMETDIVFESVETDKNFDPQVDFDSFFTKNLLNSNDLDITTTNLVHQLEEFMKCKYENTDYKISLNKDDYQYINRFFNPSRAKIDKDELLKKINFIGDFIYKVKNNIINTNEDTAEFYE